MDKVIITQPMMGLTGMQVCAHKSATDKEILAVCNAENPSGTTNGWSKVIRKETKTIAGPVQCEEHSNRTHLIVIC